MTAVRLQRSPGRFWRPPRPSFEQRDPILLPMLLSYVFSRGTRFARNRDRPAPAHPVQLGLLLDVCGYDLRVGNTVANVVEIRGAGGTWLLAPTVRMIGPVSVVALLRCVCERDWPARPMDPNDVRIEAVFAPP